MNGQNEMGYSWRRDSRALKGIEAGLYCVHRDILHIKADCELCSPKPLELEAPQGKSLRNKGNSRLHRPGLNGLNPSHIIIDDYTDEKMLKALTEKGSIRWSEAQAHLKQIEENHMVDALNYAFYENMYAAKEQNRDAESKLEIWKYILALAVAGVIAFGLNYLFLRGK